MRIWMIGEISAPESTKALGNTRPNAARRREDELHTLTPRDSTPDDGDDDDADAKSLRIV